MEHLSNAVAVCGRPDQLLQVLQQTLPPQLFQLLLQRLPAASQVRISFSQWFLFLAIYYDASVLYSVVSISMLWSLFYSVSSVAEDPRASYKTKSLNEATFNCLSEHKYTFLSTVTFDLGVECLVVWLDGCLTKVAFFFIVLNDDNKMFVCFETNRVFLKVLVWLTV